MIGNKRQRSASGVAETQVVTEDEGDEEGANGSSSAAIVRAVIDKIEWAKIDRGMKRTEIVGQLGDRG